MATFAPTTMVTSLSSPHFILPLTIASAALYAAWVWYNRHLQARTKLRSEESRSPPRRGRTLGRVPAQEAEKKDIVKEEDPASHFPDLVNLRVSEEERKQVGKDKRLYYMLQNLEDYPESLDLARTRLLQLLDHTTSSALAHPSSTILSVANPLGLEAFYSASHRSSSSKYQSYLSRRKRGSPRELLPNRDFAIQWLKLAACVKYVDGSWIANSLGAGVRSLGSTADMGRHPAGVERDAAKLAWQVISEEFGDGDLQKNHVFVFHQLIQSLSNAPTGDALDFLGPDGSPRCWSAAVAQQCIGLLAGDFFPEALGFNMAYETLPYHLLVTSYELRELRLDDYYFALHITIDNPDSGHAAMARMAVEQYLAGVEKRDGKAVAERMWRRVQAGVLLADGLPTTPSGPQEFGLSAQRWRPLPSPALPPSPLENDMVNLLHRKSSAAEHLHCPSRLLFAGQTLEQWLEPAAWTSGRGLAFLRALGDKRPWVVKGDDSKSRLVRELQWGGRMFGAFTDKEVGLVRRWIEDLGVREPKGSYHSYVGTAAPTRSALPPSRFSKAASILLPSQHAEDVDSVLPRFPPSTSHIPNRIPPISSLPLHLQSALLLTSLSLLDLFPLHPSKFASPLGSTILRIIRAQLGFPALHRTEDICAGTDEADLKGLWEAAEEHFRTQGFTLPNSLEDLAGMVDEDASAEARAVAELCADMLVLRLHPYAQTELVLELTAEGIHLWLGVMGGVEVVQRIATEVRLAIRDQLDGR